MDKPPIMGLPGYGITTRIYHTHPDLARKHMRRLYSEGVQVEFHYYENMTDHVEALQRLKAWMLIKEIGDAA